MEVAQPAQRKKTCADKLFMLEDKFLKNAGLYALFCIILIICSSCPPYIFRNK